ncbi:6852_t:CDS:1, partial [Paraglomus brasilianum]
MWSKFVGQLRNSNGQPPLAGLFGGTPPVSPQLNSPDKPFVRRRSMLNSPKSPRVTEAKRRSSILFGVTDDSDKEKPSRK